MLLENSEGIHEFIPRAEETYNLGDEPVLTGDNIEHLADKIPDDYEIYVLSRFQRRLLFFLLMLLMQLLIKGGFYSRKYGICTLYSLLGCLRMWTFGGRCVYTDPKYSHKTELAESACSSSLLQLHYNQASGYLAAVTYDHNILFYAMETMEVKKQVYTCNFMPQDSKCVLQEMKGVLYAPYYVSCV